VKHITTFGTM